MQIHIKSDSPALISCIMNEGGVDLYHSKYMQVIHASGTIRDALIEKQNVESFNSIINSKVYFFFPKKKRGRKTKPLIISP